MSNQTDIIIHEIEAEKLRRENLTLEELKVTYDKLAEQNFPDAERIRFIADLGDSREIAYHYELICKDREEGNRLNISSSFDRHGKEGLGFLLCELDKSEDEEEKVNLAYLMAENLSKMKHRDFYIDFCDRLNPILALLLTTKESKLRQKVIIAFGWVGSEREVGILSKQMLTDEDELCRAYSAASLMQMSFHRVKADLICKNSAKFFAEIIEKEQDLEALAIMIEAAQTLFGKRFITASALENVDTEKVEKARKSAVKFLSKYDIMVPV